MALQSKVQVELPLFTKVGEGYIHLGDVTVDVPVVLQAETLQVESTAVTAALLESFRKASA
jgi:hypothetical protein